MSGEERRHELLDLLSASREPISGRHLADHFKVSRQVIVQDIALLRATVSRSFQRAAATTCSPVSLRPGYLKSDILRSRSKRN